MLNKIYAKCGIIGFGKMGALHAKGYTNANVKISGIVDKNTTESIYPIFSSPQELLKNVDIVSICSPSYTHYKLALECIKAKKPTMIEKPLALNIDQCLEIKNLSNKYNIIVSVGHIERFNASFKTMLKYIHKIKNIKSIYVERTNPSSNRITDTDVIADLTTHDLDLIKCICKNDKVENIKVNNVTKDNKTGLIESIKTEFLINNINVCIYTSRIVEKAVRKIIITGENGIIESDLLNKKVNLNNTPLIVNNIDQIDEELYHWVKSVTNNKQPVVSIDDGIFAVKIGENIRNKC